MRIKVGEGEDEEKDVDEADNDYGMPGNMES